ncbi:MAG: outer membrane beta-barrel protein, partial [Methylobacteriaceae bacterium]|nr:outer membrane beta-barrel protein [Methylobacteriaceae bacterium]
MLGRIAGGLIAVGCMVAGGAASAADLPAKAPAPAPVPEACKAELSAPAFGPTIKANATPYCLPVPGFGDIYVGGALTGYAYTQNNRTLFTTPAGVNFSADRGDRVDFTNLQAWIQKADGPFQFFVQAGAYSIPGLGLPIYNTFAQTDGLFTPLPVAYGKFVINDNWSIQGGRMPTLIGSEAPFTFQNINISRGLLFNQENVINQGVQVNYANGPWSVSVAGTDGFFSGEITWFTGAVTYKLDDNNTFGVNGGVNLGRQNTTLRSFRYQFATPNLLQNSGIVSVNYTYT